MFKRVGAIGFCAAAVLLTASPAYASRPYVQHYTQPASYVDDVLCHFGPFNFDVQVNVVDQVTERDYATKTVFVDKGRATFTGPNGAQLIETEDAVITNDLITGSQTWNGVAESFSYPNGKTVAKDVGQITFDANGNIVSESGPHPIADGPGNLAVCAALAS